MMRKIAQIDGQPVLYEETDYVDEFTHTRRTMHEFIKRKPDGIRIRIPVFAPIAVQTFTRSTPIFGRDETRRLKQHEVSKLYQEHYEVILNA